MDNFYLIGYFIALLFFGILLWFKNKNKWYRVALLLLGDLFFGCSEMYYYTRNGDTHPASSLFFLIINLISLRMIFASKKSLQRLIKSKMIFWGIGIAMITIVVFTFCTEEQIHEFIPFQSLAVVVLLAVYFRKGIKANELITEQKELLEQKNREILDSIEYALRIQTAILPPQKIVKQYLENSFVLYKPKDIVAGDFYWMETVQLANEPISQLANENNQLINQSANQLILFAACDCTGHGVPGAMVSVVCHNALNRAVKEFGLTQPAAILDKTTQIVVENFSKSEEDIKDGMDISLCALNTKTKELQWAGANNPLWIVKKMDNEKLTMDNEKASNFPLSSINYQLLETKADKQPIGMNEDHHPFTNQTFPLSEGDTIYIFTDGFADQFGGDTGEKKLTRKRFKEQLVAVQHLSLPEQGMALDKFIVEYQKEVAQVDDILVMGVRL